MSSSTGTAPVAVDKAHFSVVDPSKARAHAGKDTGGRVEVVDADDKDKLFTLVTPPMLIQNPRLVGEGSLGNSFKTSTGKELCELNRAQCKFSFGIGIGNMDDEELRVLAPNLKQDQRTCMVKIYETGRSILGSIYDQRFPDFLTKISEFEADAVSAEADRLLAMKDNRVTDETAETDVTRLMKTDPAVRDRIHAKARARFISRANFSFPNPKDYDPDGNQRNEQGRSRRPRVPCGHVLTPARPAESAGRGRSASPNRGPRASAPLGPGKNKRLAVYMKRKCWKRKREFARWEAKRMPARPTATQLDPSNPDNWPEICRVMSSHYEWNPLRFHDGATGTELKRPFVRMRDGPEGPPVSMPDPRWTPMPENKQTLATMRLMFGVFTVEGSYGVKVMPWPDLYIMRQRKATRGGIDTTGYAGMATGVMADEPAVAAAAVGSKRARGPDGDDDDDGGGGGDGDGGKKAKSEPKPDDDGGGGGGGNGGTAGNPLAGPEAGEVPAGLASVPGVGGDYE